MLIVKIWQRMRINGGQIMSILPRKVWFREEKSAKEIL